MPRYMYSAIKGRKLLGKVRSFGDIIETDRSELRTIGSLISQGILTPVPQDAEPTEPVAPAEPPAPAKKATVKKVAAKKAAAAPAAEKTAETPPEA